MCAVLSGLAPAAGQMLVFGASGADSEPVDVVPGTCM